MMGGLLGFGTFEYRQLLAANHFRDLAVVGTPPKAPSGKPSTTPVPTVNLPGTFNVVLIGSDARKGDKISHSDTVVLVHVDLNHHVYDMISLPRDARTYFPNYGYTKLTTIQYMNENKYGVKNGIEKTVATISNVTGVPINYYAETNFWGLQDMVNAVGGIDINLPFTIRLTHPWHQEMKGQVYKKGPHFLNGAQTIEVVRERDSVPGGDYGRQQIQERALIGIAKEVLKPSNISRLPALAHALPKFLIATNMSAEDVISLGLNVRGNFHPDTQIRYFQIPSVSEYLHDAVLQAPNDELLLDQKKLHSIIARYFLDNASDNAASDTTANGTFPSESVPDENAGAQILESPSDPQDFGPLGGPS